MKYKVEIEETLLRTVEIEADSADDAEKKARKLYRDAEIKIDSLDYITKNGIKTSDLWDATICSEPNHSASKSVTSAATKRCMYCKL